MGEKGSESIVMAKASLCTKVASMISKLKDSALQLMTSISSLHNHKDEDYVPKVDGEFSQEPDLEAYGTPINNFKDSPTNSQTSSSSIHNHKDEDYVPKVDEEFSQQPDLEANGTPTNHFKDSPTNSPTSSSITHLSRSSTPSPSHEPSCECHGQQKLSNPIAQAFRKVELGKALLTMVMPIAIILLAMTNRESSPQLLPSTLCLISVAMVFLFYGNSLRIIYPKIANAFEQLGIACMYASFFMTIGSHLSPTLVWFALVCFIACIILSTVTCLPFEKKKCSQNLLML